MTELNQEPDTGVSAASAQWPPLSSRGATDAGTTRQVTGDRDVDRILGLLSAVPGMPVPEQGEVYAELHDALLEALNAEPPSVPAGSPPQANPQGHPQQNAQDHPRQ